MNEPPTFDELASAYLDGELDELTQRRVGADPELAARVDELRAVSDLLSQPVDPLTPAARDSLVAAAMAAAPMSSRPATQVPHRRARGRGVAWSAAWVGAAAAVLLVAVTAIALSRRDEGGGDVVSAPSSEPTTELAAERSAAPAAEAGAAETEDAAPGAPEGAGADTTAAVAPAEAGDAAVTSEGTGAGSTLPPILATIDGLTDVEAADGPNPCGPAVAGAVVATARYEGTEVVVLVDTTRVRVVDAECSVLVEVAVP